MIEQTWELIKHDAATNYLAWAMIVMALAVSIWGTK
jgi:hypothetical protein